MILKYPAMLLIAIPILLVLWISHSKITHGKKLLYPMHHRGLKFKSGLAQYMLVLPLLLKISAAFFLVIALARPQTSTSHTKRSAEGVDIMIALDVSKSMVIEDYKPYSRLDVAKETIRRFIAGRKDDRIGFLMFSGDAVTLCPPTLDYEMLDRAVESADTEQLKDGTAIGDALATAVGRIKDSKSPSRIIILVTDGDNNMGSIAPLTAGSLAQGYGIKVYSIALGKEGLVPFPEIDYSSGRPYKIYHQVESTINPELLMKISAETGGKFFRPTEADALKKVFAEIDKLEKSKVEKKENIQWNEHYQKFLLLGLCILFLDFILSRTRLRVLPN